MSDYRRSSPKKIHLTLPGRGRTEVMWVQGPVAAPTLVLLHGWTGSGSMNWRWVTDELSMRANLLILDMPGHGNGPRPIGRFSFDDCANYVIDVCERLKIKHAVMVGYSMGSGVALAVAAKKPSLVEGLMTVGGAARFVNARDLTTMSKVLPGIVFSTAMAASYVPLMRNLRAESLIALAEAAADLTRHNWQIVADAGVAIRNFDGRAIAKNLHCPAAVIVPLGDKLVPPTTQFELADLIPNSVEIPIPGHHLVVWADPETLATAMISGLQQIRQMQRKQRPVSGTNEQVA